MMSNCWIYALPKWFRGEFTYLIIRPSKQNKYIPHVMLTNDLKDVVVEDFQPNKPKRGWRAFLHMPLFKGYIHRGKDE